MDKRSLEKLYIDDGKSLKEIADNFRCSVNKVQYWMKKFNIKSRSRSEALYLKHNPDGDPFLIKKEFSKDDLILLGLGLGLWWGEGSKRHKGTIRLGNTDPLLIKKFLEFLYKICAVKKEKLRFGLQVFSDMDPNLVKDYWMKELSVDSGQFLPKVVVTPARGNGTYKQKTKFGVLTIYCANIKLKAAFDDLMRQYI